MEQKTESKTPSAHFLEVLGLFGRVGQNIKLLNDAMTATFTMLSAPDVKKDDQAGQEACTKLAVVLAGIIEAGAGRPLPRSVIYYREVTLASMPDDIRARIAKAGSAYKLCVSLYGEYRKLYMAWLGAQTQQPEDATPAQETPQAAAPAPEKTPVEEAPPPPKPTRKTKKEMVKAAEPTVPEVTADASVEVQAQDTPHTNPIPPDEPPAESPEDDAAAAPKVAEEAKAQEETPADGAVLFTLDPQTKAYIDKKFDALEKNITTTLTTQMKRLEPIAPAFNALREYLMSTVNKG
jgi:hypothetical protein